MFKQQQEAGGQGSGLLSVFDSIQIKNEEKIPAEDRKYCEQLQQELYRVLDQLTEWYVFFKDKAAEYENIYTVSYCENGSVHVYDIPFSGECKERYFIRNEFKPFNVMNEIVECYSSILSSFKYQIINYFNEKYKIHVPVPEEKGKIKWGYRPAYQYLVDMVVGYLGGRGFREVAEEEILQKFHESTVTRAVYRREPSTLRGDKIVFPAVLWFDEFYKDTNHIQYNYRCYIEYFCAGIALCDGTIHGNSNMIIGFNENNVDLSRWYELTTTKATGMKFYKNGRIDVRFMDKTTAEQCFLILKLDQYLPKNPKE